MNEKDTLKREVAKYLGGSEQRWWRSRLVIGVAVFVAVAVIAVCVAWALTRSVPSVEKESTDSSVDSRNAALYEEFNAALGGSQGSSSATEEGDGTPTGRGPDSMRQGSTLQVQDTSKAVGVYSKAIAAAETKDEKTGLMISRTAALVLAGDSEAALRSAEEAVAFNPTHAVYASIAQVYGVKGDTAAQRRSLEKAAESVLVDASLSDADKESLRTEYQEMIVALG